MFHQLRKHRGLTLMEVLLVLALLVIIAAVAAPRFNSTFSQQRLKKGADMVRAELARARVRAMKSGQTQVFRHLLSSDGFITMTQTSPEDFVEVESMFASDVGVTTNMVGVGGLGVTTEMERLPKGVRFFGADVAVDERTAVQLTAYQQSGGGANVPVAGQATTAASWGMPVFFYPDGTTSSARIVLANQEQSAIAIELRGLTGVTRVSPVETTNGIVPVERTQ
ncbi:MAG: prepilin-type N-terminal cleavage/methylation domain-containing protein [Pirellulaceae bacterium]